MKSLKVPYIKQINENACGAAALEMVYSYYNYKNFSQKDLMIKHQELEPHGSGNFRLSTDNLVLNARQNGFNTILARAIWRSIPEVIALIEFAVDSGVPLIVCQKFTVEQPLIGHFRIVVGIDNDSIYLHDPSIDSGGENLKWPIDKFIDFWKPTGDNVTGGIFIFIKNDHSE